MLVLRLLRASDKGEELCDALAAWRAGQQTGVAFEPNTATFREIPDSPFAYWVSDRIRALFGELAPFGSKGRTVKQGLATANDFRFVRAWWEVDPRKLGRKWYPFVKGGEYSPFYADVHLVVNWGDGGREMYAFDKAYVRNRSYYFRPGLTWPRRTGGLSFRSAPRGSVFGDKGPMAFVSSDDPEAIMAVNAVANSKVFGYLVSLRLARTELAQSYEVGLIQGTAMPALDAAARSTLSDAAMAAWSLKRASDRHIHSSHAFVLPALLQTSGESLAIRATRWSERTGAASAEFAAIRSEIDEIAIGLYGISDEDRNAMEQGPDNTADASTDAGADDSESPDATEGDAAVEFVTLVSSLLEWCVGVAFGHFDIRLATGNRKPPRDPEPFDPLPRASPGMLAASSGIPSGNPPAGYPISIPADGVLVDDVGHQCDIVRRVRLVFDQLDPQRGHRWLDEACEAIGSDLRVWLSRAFFKWHLARHSRSRRKAPVFWQLGTMSRSYSVWLYYPRLTRDSSTACSTITCCPSFATRRRSLPSSGSARLPAPPHGGVAKSSVSRTSSTNSERSGPRSNESRRSGSPRWTTGLSSTWPRSGVCWERIVPGSERRRRNGSRWPTESTIGHGGRCICGRSA